MTEAGTLTIAHALSNSMPRGLTELRLLDNWPKSDT